jgi:SAM-dependent methyltransferase
MVEQFECSFCGEKEYQPAFNALDFDHSIESFELRQCARCGVTQTSPCPDSVSLEQYYSRSYYGGGTKKFSGIIESLTVLGCKFRAKKIFNVLAKTRLGSGSIRVLDIGCGRANLLHHLKTTECECYGTEREKYPSDSSMRGIAIHRGSLEERKFENSFFDAVIIWHVLEHLHQPAVTLDEITRITRKGGLVAIAVPNFSSLQSRLFKSNWFHLDLPRHLYHFDADNLSKALTQRGYVIHSVSTCSLEQNLFGFIQSLMNKLRFLGKPNNFYQLLKQHSGIAAILKLALLTLIALLILPLALVEFVISCILKKGASVIIFAHKT